jgi:acetolactate synthase I/II/III large subunit
MSEREMTGAEIVVQALQDQGVEHIFGYPGGAVLPIYDALFQQDAGPAHPRAPRAGRGARRRGLCALFRQGRRAAGDVGPGATNAVTGLTDAMMDSIPLVCITGQVPTHLIGSDAFQECDTVGITRHCTKHNFLVKDVDDLPRMLHEAFYRRLHRPSGPGRRRHPQGRAVHQARNLRRAPARSAQDLSAAPREGRHRVDPRRRWS